MTVPVDRLPEALSQLGLLTVMFVLLRDWAGRNVMVMLSDVGYIVHEPRLVLFTTPRLWLLDANTGESSFGSSAGSIAAAERMKHKAKRKQAVPIILDLFFM